jgi:hypothetical protein
MGMRDMRLIERDDTLEHCFVKVSGRTLDLQGSLPELFYDQELLSLTELEGVLTIRLLTLLGWLKALQRFTNQAAEGRVLNTESFFDLSQWNPGFFHVFLS